jgi:hypothetical protein
LPNGTYEEISLVGSGGASSYISNVALNGTDLEFTGTGLAFNSSVDLSSLGGGSFTLEGYNEIGTRVGGDLISTIGDYDDSNNGTKINIDDSNSEIIASSDGNIYLFANNGGTEIGQLGLTPTSTFLRRYLSAGGPFDTRFYIGDPTASNFTVTLETPLGIAPNTDLTLPLSVNGNYADSVGNITISGPTGLEALDEGNGVGWRLIGANTSERGNIGKEAVDLAFSLGGTSYGATGKWSITAGGVNNTASGRQTSVFGGANNIVSGRGGGAIVGGQNNIVSGRGAGIFGGNTSVVLPQSGGVFVGGQNTINNTALYGVALGGFRNTINGEFGTVLNGRDNTSHSWSELVTGLYSTNYVAGSTGGWVASDRLFTIGNGTTTLNRSDALIVLKDGTITAPSLTPALITTAGNPSLITKEYADANYSGGGSINLYTAEITITDPTITGGAYSQQMLVGQGVGKAVLVHSLVAIAKNLSVGTGDTSIKIRYSGDGGALHGGTLFKSGGGNGVLNASSTSVRRGISGDNVAINCVLTNTTDQAFTGVVKAVITYSLIDLT